MATTRVYRRPSVQSEFVDLSADTTLTHSHSGKILSLDAVGEAITLPAVAAGLNYKFICNTTTATSDWVITAP